ncbi:YesK family protein [Bacillus sp. NPDC094106]|uniref:YesK family protein n=1 Tax=Bacillus sp. NPDC094106 TaxID=3363949 RepID=UPI0038243660
MDGFFELTLLGPIIFLAIISSSAFLEKKYPQKQGIKFLFPSILILLSCFIFFISIFYVGGLFGIGISVLCTIVLLSSTLGFIASVFIRNKKEQ